MSRGLEIDAGRGEAKRPDTISQVVVRNCPVVLARLARPPDPRQRSATLPRLAFTLPRGPERDTVRGRGRSYRVRDTQSLVLVAAGTFRVVFERDLQDTVYRNDSARLTQDVRHLVRQGLVERHSVAADRHGHAVAVLTLTRDGQHVLEQHRRVSRAEGRHVEQAVCSGWRKVSEVVHDASVYRMYQVEAARIEADGGVIRRIVLGDELKRQCYAAATPAGRASPGDRHAALAQAAARLDLPVVAGHVEFPDLRLEYETPTGDRTRVDLELVTDAYRAGHIAAKQAAGFALYSAGGASHRGIASLGGSPSSSPRAGASHDRFISSLLSL
jgi:hypothetical protein